VRLIRAGQTCQVWEAISDIDKSRRALKALQPEVRADKVEIDYLKHEFAVARDFDHVNVIKVYEFSTDRAVPYLVMELSLGRNMKIMMRQEKDYMHYHIADIIDGCLDGLQYMHEAGWIHHDVKPDNFLIDPDGTVKLIDFAIAKRLKTNPLAKLFGKNKIQGTRSYMAPEQIRGKTMDQRSDIYSLGCMLFEIIGGKPPFTASTPEELLTKHLRSPVPSLMAQNNNVTQEFNQLIANMMFKDIEMRPESSSKLRAMCKATRVFKSRPKAPDEPDEGQRGN